MGGRWPVTTVDARGLRCPAPVIQLARAAAQAPGGTELTVLATDPAAVHDVPAWARMRGHQMVGVTERDGVHALTVRTHA
ncbi:sulfurtransferase TusA family protein [Cellulomonas sp. zg-ZUI188]|uniref:Sulfurtransferase TusA family protein n=1 Tax=Cellulomonas fengjieae TaxID=2819978 RepID=A0ABS3SFQ4_9CELL|nr:sulfurtransferase TusA family protein [Cellulomonas fengjieae]QVI64595.1 sulfurtransferase TusA family protein [Cellulomonas fengjieae]